MSKLAEVQEEPAEERLARLREDVDCIDDAIAGLITRRMAISSSMVRAKGDPAWLLLRPLREAAVLQRLSEAHPDLPAALIAHVWRELMGHSLQAQRATGLVLHGRNEGLLLALARGRFGSAAPVRVAETASEALAETLDGRAIAVIENESRPPRLDPRLSLIDSLEDETGRPVALVIGRLDPDEVRS